MSDSIFAKLILNSGILCLKYNSYSKSIQLLSTCNFNISKISSGLGIKQEIPITINPTNIGGRPSSPFFYKNPQFIIRAGVASAGVKTAAVRISYQGPQDSYVLAILTQPKDVGRVLALTKEMQISKTEDSLKYRPQFSCIETELYTNTNYTVIFSNYELDMLGDYKAIFESEIPLQIEQIKPEGYGLTQYEIPGEWDYSNSGGSVSSAQYYTNPIFAFRLNCPTDLQIRIRMIQENYGGGAVVTDPSSFQFAVRLSAYKQNYHYPPIKGEIGLSPALNEILNTNKGVYTNSSGLLVTERVFFIMFVKFQRNLCR